MKSMVHRQNEMIAKADSSGGYPRVVHVGMGIIALAHTKKELDELQHDAMIGAVIMVVGMLAIFFGAILFVIYQSAIA